MGVVGRSIRCGHELGVPFTRLEESLCQYCVCVCTVYHALYLEELTAAELIRKLACVCGLPLGQINQVYRHGPTGIHILLSDQVKSTHTHSLSHTHTLYIFLYISY